MNLKDVRPYVIGAHLQWLDDSNASPHITIQNGSKTIFPSHLAAHSVVTFNVSQVSVKGLHLDENGLSFSARFNGKEFKIFAPLECLLQLHSVDGRIRIPLTLNNPPPQSPEFHQEVLPEPSSVLIKGGTSDGIKRGKLTLVPKSPKPEEPGEPECA